MQSDGGRAGQGTPDFAIERGYLICPMPMYFIAYRAFVVKNEDIFLHIFAHTVAEPQHALLRSIESVCFDTGFMQYI